MAAGVESDDAGEDRRDRARAEQPRRDAHGARKLSSRDIVSGVTEYCSAQTRYFVQGASLQGLWA